MALRGLFQSGLVVAALTSAGPALACLPQPADWTPPTFEERVQAIADGATDIVYGVVVRGSDGVRPVRFRVLHVYRGEMRRGEVLRARLGWGFDPPPCATLLGPPPVSRGTYGVIAFRADWPELNFVGERELELLFRTGTIQSAHAAATTATSQR